MTDTKPTLEAQIEWAEVLIKCDSGIAPAVLASLEELAAIKSQPVPVEPELISECSYCGLTQAVTLKSYNTMQSALQVAQQELEVQMVGWSDCEEKLTKAEAELAALVEAVQKEHGGEITNPRCPICIALAEYGEAVLKDKNSG